MSEPIVPRLFPKNTRKTLRLSIDDYKGRILLAARIWFATIDGADLRPRRDGWAIHIAKLPEIAEAFADLEAEARAAGLVP